MSESVAELLRSRLAEARSTGEAFMEAWPQALETSLAAVRGHERGAW